ncbi:unnamed protein product, partial [Musa acuminata subsp. burmannicoides]
SVWNSKEVFPLEVRGAGRWRQRLARASRAVDRALPWLRIPRSGSHAATTRQGVQRGVQRGVIILTLGASLGHLSRRPSFALDPSQTTARVGPVPQVSSSLPSVNGATRRGDRALPWLCIPRSSVTFFLNHSIF